MSIDYREKVEEIVDTIPTDRRIEADDVIKRLRKKGRSFEWIYTALSSKSMKVWSEKGFGLLLSADYQCEIDNKLAAKAARVVKAGKDKEKFYEAYDKYYAMYQENGPVERIPFNSIPKETVVFNKNWNPDSDLHFNGPYRESLSDPGRWYYFGTFEEFNTKMGIANAKPQQLTFYAPIYWNGEGKLVEKGKLWDIH